MRAHWRKDKWVLGGLYFWAGSCYTFFLACVTIRINFLKCFAVRAECPSTANFCHQCGQQLNLSQVLNKAASSFGNEKLFRSISIGDIVYTQHWLCAQVTAVADVFKVLWCILSLILGASDQMSNLVRFFCCSSSLQVTAEADVLGSSCVRFLKWV